MLKKKIQISTKLGDQGYSSLFSGEKVLKNSPRLEAYGNLDELVSFLSLARHHVRKSRLKKEILNLQKNLFIVSSELATADVKLNQLKQRVDEAMLTNFERTVESLFNVTDIPNGFVIPGTTLASAYLDYARAMSRRCERKIVELFENKHIDNRFLLVWMNRLSEYLYLMARFEEGKPILVKSRE